MTAHVELPDPIAAALDGERRAARLIHAARDDHVPPDRLMHDLLDVLADDGRVTAPSVRLRGFCRRLQKYIEGRP